MPKFTLLEEKHVRGAKKLSFIDTEGTKCAVTDFAILLGANYTMDTVHDTEKLEDRTVDWFLKTSWGGDDVGSINSRGFYNFESLRSHNVGIRPCFDYYRKGENMEEKYNSYGSLEIECGEYPQMVANLQLSQKLERELKNKRLKQTGKQYTINGGSEGSTRVYEPHEVPEYHYNGKKYVRILGNNRNKGHKLSDGRTIKKDNPYWIEVSPVRWLIDKKNHIALSKKALLSGIPFNNGKYNNDFANTILGRHLFKYFTKEIGDLIKPVEKQEETPIINNNLQVVYNFKFTNVSEEELIKGSLESNIALFLHGRSSEGKSARIKQFDPDAEIVYLRNATPDSLNGKSVYDSKNNKMIDVPPTWYVKLKEKCEKEPDKLHIVFFDELTNALPSIQGMAFNIILDKEINGKWKLPENARVAAAGNDLEDSLAANTMAEPLFNRFNHAYIKTTVESWLKWALTPNDSYERLDYKKQNNSQLKIHPAIITFIASEGEPALRELYNGITPNADPRKWEMASKVLYQTNNPYMLRGLIGKNLTDDFVEFYKRKVITLKNVLNGNYDLNALKLSDERDKYLMAATASKVDIENYEIARGFIEKIGERYLKLFNMLWSTGDKEKIKYVDNYEINKIKVKK